MSQQVVSEKKTSPCKSQ